MNCDLSPEEISILQSIFQRKYLPLSSYHINAITFWSHIYKFAIKHIKDVACIFAHDHLGVFQHIPAVDSRGDVAVINECFQYMQAINGVGGVTRIENVSYDQLAYFPKEEFVSYLKGYEYLYYKKNLVELKGNAYKSKRASYNHFKKSVDSRYCAYETAMKDECLALYDLWKKQRYEKHTDEIYRNMLEENRGVHRFILEHAQRLNLTGRVLEIEGEIKAYTFGYSLSDNIFCVVCEVADLNFNGISAYLFKEFCSDYDLAAYQFINTMDDCGCESMRSSKLSYRPEVLLPVYTITKR